ncbi:glutamine--fructose-6-phosphate transaminase (isomerizing) [Caldivirga maquilingensis]|uniref:glutamine--fructose-6-phosphate transaminase (isomerizing) n=1 Tax=Caldivirga maquilingensis TaxID=76887 RepID=UPI00064EBAD7|nr:glutamine--fructose-6-phosphate transaminase (isomerizing) [Caldivirga maquilingensis]
MCGIVGVAGSIGERLGSALKKCLERLEYRGYDSAGIAVTGTGGITVRKGKGKINEVDARFNFTALDGLSGIGHTRWATHGKPSDENAHPHVDCTGEVAVVHNGIIANYRELKEQLMARGHRFISDTDTEVIAHLFEDYVKAGLPALVALRETIRRLKGSYAIALLYSHEPDKVFFARNVSPLVIGVGEGFNFLASDIPAFLNYTNRVITLHDGEYGYLTPSGIYVERNGEPVNVEDRVRVINWSPESAGKEGYPHFMLKEIHEQPRALRETWAGLDMDYVSKLGKAIAEARRVFITASGTSYHAGLILDYLLVSLAGLDAHAFNSSEYRKYIKLVKEGDILIAISQSGETIDTLMATRVFRERGAKVLAVSNVVDSTIPRESDYQLYTNAGPEIGVAATKTFTTQLMILTALAANAALHSGGMGKEAYSLVLNELEQAPDLVNTTIINVEARVRHIAGKLAVKTNAYYLSRGIGLPIAMEGALKMKEVAYVHAEAYPAGESKHGPIALVNQEFPVVFTVTDDDYLDPLEGNVMEMTARGAYTIGILPSRHYAKLGKVFTEVIQTPDASPYLLTIIQSIPLQLLAYHTAVLRGYDPDKPRNLAKTVTVE